MKPSIRTGLLAFGAMTFAAAASADIPTPPEGRTNFSLKPGGSRLVYVAGPGAETVLPVFKICLNSSPAGAVLVEFSKPGNSDEAAQTETLVDRSCLFASGRRLEVSAVEAKSETGEDSADWLEERIKDLQAKIPRTDEEEGQLRRYKMDLHRKESHITLSLIPQ